jgi:hypothetical protein
MKQIVKNYTFNTATKAITLTNFSAISLDRLQLIVDTTTNKILYNFADSTVTTASISSNVITLGALQGGENNADKLQIVYDSSAGEPNYDVYKEVSSSTVSALNNDLIPSTDVSSFRWLSLHFVTSFTGTITFQMSNDNSNWVNCPLLRIDAGAYTTTAGSSSNLIYAGPITYRYFRIRATAYTSGSPAGVLELFTTPPPLVNQAMSTGTSISHFSTAGNTGDGTGNGPLSVGAYLFNGSNFDRFRANVNTTTGDSGAKTATFNGATQVNYNNKFAVITVLCGTVSGTTPTLNAQFQFSPDAGTTWLNMGPASSNITATNNSIVLLVGPTNFSQAAGVTPANLTTGGTQTVAINGPLPRTWRLAYTIGGTTPSFALTAVYVNYVGL